MPGEFLDTLRSIVQEVNQAPDLRTALDITVERVRERLHADAASVYFWDEERGELVLMATRGLPQESVGRIRLRPGQSLVGLVLERAEPVSLENAADHPRYQHIPEAGEEPFHAFLGVPIIQHGQVVGVLVVRQYATRRFGREEETFLLTLASQLAGAILQAAASGEVAGLLAPEGGRTRTLRGVPGAPGLALGRARVIISPTALESVPDHELAASDVEAEIARFRQAVDKVVKELRALSGRLQERLSERDRAIFDAYLLMLTDEALVEETIGRIRQGNWAPGAWRETVLAHVRVFERMEDPYLRERASDIRELGQRVLAGLLEEVGESELPEGPVILVGEEVAASHLADVPESRLAGIVSARGSGASHVAILAHALGIPAVMGVEELPVARMEDRRVAIDGYQGRLYVNPSGTILAEFERLLREEQELERSLAGLGDLPSETPDGHHVPLHVNTGLLADITPSLRSGAEGVGLYRTEVPFLIRSGFPTEDEQVDIYRQVLEAFAPRPVTVRTLDVGGDKPLPYFPIEEANPFLGWRGIRLLLDHPELFLMQLRAILRANDGLGNARIMLPMVKDPAELHEGRRLLRQAWQELREEGHRVPLPELGVMVEVPSLIYLLDRILPDVAFLSIGSNDLTQYLLAVDRNNSRVAELYDWFHPAVLAALASVLETARSAGRPVSVCGEMAGDPMAALLLLGLGVTSLSMSVGSVPRVKWVIRSFNLDEARVVAQRALQADDGDGVRAVLSEALEARGLGGLVRAGK